MIQVTTATIPDELTQCKQWVLWKKAPGGDGKTTKIPYQPNGAKADTSDPATWATFNAVCKAYRRGGFDGIGFVFSRDDDFVGIDLDNCRDPETGEIADWAKGVISTLKSYSEISPSGRGIHIIMRGHKPGRRCKSKYHGGVVEMYDSGRYFTVTGDVLSEYPLQINNDQGAIDRVYNLVFGIPKKTPKNIPTNNKAITDSELIKKAMHAANGAQFRLLFSGDWEAAGYPSQSEADLALCCMLAYWTGNDYNRIDALFRQSGLYRDKWERDDYRQATISRAMELTTTTYAPGQLQAHGEGASVAKSYNLTEEGNAQRFFDMYRDRLRYNHTNNKWHIWDGRRWAEDNTLKVEELAKEIPKQIFAEAAKIDDDELRRKVAGHALKSETAKVLKNTLRLASSIQAWAIRTEWMDTDKYLFNVANGTLELRPDGFVFREHRREDNLTKLASVEYNPQATCPKWQQFIAEIFRTPEGEDDPETVRFIRQALSLCLTGDTSEQYLFFAYGTGANGKSTFFECLKALYGDYYQKAPIDMLMATKRSSIPNDIARLQGARIVVANEIQSGARMKESVVKDLTGGDTITARFLHQEFFQFSPTHKLWIYGNHKPRVVDADNGIWRRLLLIPFDQQFTGDQANRNLKAELKAELAGILNWVLEGWVDYCHNGLVIPERVRVASREYRNEMNNVYRFLAECCEFNTTYSTPIKKIYEAYKFWCAQNGEYPVKNREFKERLIDQGLPAPQIGTGGIYYWLGIQLTEDFLYEMDTAKFGLG